MGVVRQTRVAAACVVVAMLTAACGSGTHVSTRSRPLELAAGSPTRSSVPVAAGQGPLVPGTYYTSRFRPTIVFSASGGDAWTLDNESPGILYLTSGEFLGEFVEVYVVSPRRARLTVMEPAVAEQDTANDPNRRERPFPDDYLMYLAASEFLDAGAARRGTVLGLEGPVLDVTVAHTPEGGPCLGGAPGLCFSLFRYGSADALEAIEPAGTEMRVWSLQAADGPLLVIAASLGPPPLDLDAGLQALLTSMELA